MKLGVTVAMTPSSLHACDLIVRRLDDVDHHPAPITDRHDLVDGLVGPQHPFELVADEAAQPDAEPGRVDADLHEPVVVERVVEVPRPCLVGVVLADDGGGLLVGDVDADAFEPEHVVAAAAVAEPRGPLLDHLGETAIVDRRAGHAQREVRAHREVAVLVDPAGRHRGWPG